jgi:cobalt-zinc-cadmium efflux system protein
LAWYAAYLSTLAVTETKTYGYRRAEELAAVINSVSLLVLSGLIIWEAYQRFQSPQPIKTGALLAVASIGLLGNVYMAVLLHRARRQSLNLKAAWLHVLGDLLGSVAVVANALVVRATGLFWFDPAVSVFIALLILLGALRVLKEAGNVLLEGVPKGIDLPEVEAAIRQVPAVKDLHDLHLWNISSNLPALSAHILVDLPSTHEAQKALDGISQMLALRFGIRHTTFQFECACCSNDGRVCCVLAAHP